jgi:hypothetical protein
MKGSATFSCEPDYLEQSTEQDYLKPSTPAMLHMVETACFTHSAFQLPSQPSFAPNVAFVLICFMEA